MIMYVIVLLIGFVAGLFLSLMIYEFISDKNADDIVVVVGQKEMRDLCGRVCFDICRFAEDGMDDECDRCIISQFDKELCE